MSSKQVKTKGFIFTKTERSLWLVLLFLLLIVTMIGAVFGAGYRLGYNAGEKEFSAQAGGFATGLTDIANPFRNVTGDVTEINDGIIVVNVNEEEKPIGLNEATTVQKDGGEIPVDDISEGQRVTVFINTVGEGSDELVAKKIIVRSTGSE